MWGSYRARASPTSATRVLHRQGRGEDRRAECRPDADLGAGARGARQGQCRARPADLHHQPAEGREGCRSRVHRGRNSCAARRRACRPDLRLRGGARAREGDQPGNGRRHQVHRAGRYRRPDRGNPARGGRRPRFRSLPIPSSSARARRSPTSSIPTGSSSAPRTSRRAGGAEAKSTGRCSSTARRSCSPGGAPPS